MCAIIIFHSELYFKAKITLYCCVQTRLMCWLPLHFENIFLSYMHVHVHVGMLLTT